MRKRIVNFEPPGHVVYVEGFPRRVRAQLDGETVIDSAKVSLCAGSSRSTTSASTWT